MFGMVRGNDTLFAIVETWWDCEVFADHVPGDRSSLDFHWLGSLGKLAYPRRLLLRFDGGMDYVAMAKTYRVMPKNKASYEHFKKKLNRRL